MSTEQEIREMHDEQANPQNAVVSIKHTHTHIFWGLSLDIMIFIPYKLYNLSIKPKYIREHNLLFS